jgi:hypothetical protein
VGGQHHAPAALPRERPGTHCTGGWVGPRAVWMCAKNLAPTGIRFPDRSARSQSLYRLSYRASIICCTLMYYYILFVLLCSYSFNIVNNTSQQDFVPRKVYCVSNVTFYAESKYAIKMFPSPTVFVEWNFLLLIFRNFSYFLQSFFST